MNPIRTGVIGVGNMGSFYADRIASGDIEGAKLTAICDPRRDRWTRWPDAKGHANVKQMLAESQLDAVVIATPHYAHTDAGIAALEQGLHVLVDKPVSVHKADAVRLLAAHRNPVKVFAAMFNQRTDGYFLKIKELIDSGALGPIRRVQWTITNWFRSEAYYASSDWRATWAGEGGGVLLNQCPHQLDLMCWLFGTPSSVSAFCHFGKYHDIEVEDDVTAYLEYPGDATGVFIASTGEAPGTNRLEIVAELGKLVLENDRLSFHRNEVSMSEFSRSTPEFFAAPANTVEEFSGLDHGPQHLGVLKNFFAAIRDGVPLIAPAGEGLASVELANAMLLSSFEGRRVELPIDADVYALRLRERIEHSTHRKPVRPVNAADMKGSFR